MSNPAGTGPLGRLRRLVDDDAVPGIIDHVHRLLVCGLVFAVGAYAREHGQGSLGEALVAGISGLPIMAAAAVLTLLNLADGVHRLARLGYPLAFRLALVAMYVLLSLRLVMWASGMHSPH